MADLDSWIGSSSRLRRVEPGVVAKYPMDVWKESPAYQRLTDEIANKFIGERRILEHLGEHPRIVKYFGFQETSGGLLLAEASHGSLQRCLDENYDAISITVRRKWCRQLVEAIAYIHDKGVFHSDLRPDNVLVHATTPTCLDLWLCDFGGSRCQKIGVDSIQLPDAGFYSPKLAWQGDLEIDIFSVGSLLYTILTGHWPYRAAACGPFEGEERMAYYDKVDELFRQGIFPSVEGFIEGEVIMGCWTSKYPSADDVLRGLDMVWTKTNEC